MAQTSSEIDTGLISRFRTKINKESPQQIRDRASADKAHSIWKYCMEARRRTEFEWFINDQFYTNNQYLKYNTTARVIQQVTADRISDRIVVNKIAQIVRGVVSYLNKEHPTVAVFPGIESDEAYSNAKKEKHLIDNWYDRLQMNRKIKQITLDGAKYSLGWAKITWNNEAIIPTIPYDAENGQRMNKGYGDVQFDRADPFEIYPDPLARDKTDMRYIVHAVPRTVAELKANPAYRNTDRITPDDKLSASLIKQTQIRMQMASSQQYLPSTNPELQTVILQECYVREYDQESKKWQIRVISVVEGGDLALRDEIWPVDEFPFEHYQTDVAGRVLDGLGVIRNIREINRALNQQTSQILETSRIMGKINWKIPRGSNVNVIDDTTGQFIEYDMTPGGSPEQAQPVGLPNYILQLSNNLERYMEDISGTHQAFYGQAPGSRSSGELVSQLQNGDSNNLAMMRDNLDDFLVRCFKLMLKTAKVHMKQTMKFRRNEYDELGQFDWIEIKPGDISTSDDIQVRSGTNMPYNLSEKQDLFLNLWKEKIISDPQVILKMMELPDVENIMGDEQMDIDRQLEENRLLVQGKVIDPPVIAESHETHLRVLDKLIKSPLYKTLKPEIQQRIEDHRAQHIDFSIQIAQITASMQQDPIKRSEQLTIRMANLNEMTPLERTQYMSKYGVQSDAAQIQLRGGLLVQDPASAEQQAQIEDMNMMDNVPQQVGLTDNHQVHIETHGQIVSSPQFKAAPQVVQKLFTDHINNHMRAMQAINMQPGLMVDEEATIPNQPRLQSNEPTQTPQQAGMIPPNQPQNISSTKKSTPKSKRKPRQKP